MLHFGTSGFSYSDWVDSFYPRGMPRREWLIYYAREFNALELNSTYYALPKPSVVEAMVGKTGEGFLFSVKANQEMTHQRQQDSSVFVAFVNMLQPFIDAGKLGCVLAQFPHSFGCSRQNCDYLALFRERLRDLPLVVEFRHAQWLKPEVFDWLRNHNIGFCCVDEPQLPNLLPPLAEVTGNTGYVRFHGRNAAKWWQHEHAYERYDYAYSVGELKEWLPRIRKLDSLTEKVFVFANNHWRGQAIGTIRQLRLMLD
ncbi:MAG: DUF72 domain-containing protein [Dehalococcoidia bacterium]|nr:DUF72 domain-containing protein [Dehalococcoidia bacterium]